MSASGNPFADPQAVRQSAPDNPFVDAPPKTAPNNPFASKAAPTATIQAVPEPETLGGQIEQTWNDFANDVRTGSDSTSVGRLLHKIGMQPTNAGQGEKVGDFMASPILGTAKASQGVGQVMQPGKRSQGVKNVVGGLVEASQIPAAFVAPEAEEVAANTVGKIAGKVDAAVRPVSKLNERVVDTLSQVADQEGFSKGWSSVTHAFGDLSDQFVQRAKSAYQAVDKAADGALNPVIEKIRDTKNAIATQKNLDPDKAETLAERLEELVGLKNKAVQRASQNGVNNAEQLVKQADVDYSKGKALASVRDRVNNASGVAREGGKTNPSKFASVVDNTKMQGKMDWALGPQARQALQQDTRKALTTQKVVRTAAKGGAIAGAVAGIAEAGRKLTGE